MWMSLAMQYSCEFSSNMSEKDFEKGYYINWYDGNLIS